MAEKFRRMMLEGLPVDGLDVIDAHDHMGPYFNFRVHRNGSAAAMLERAYIAGIGKVCAAAHAAIGPDMVWGNDEVSKAIKAHPGRVYGYVTIKPCPEQEMDQEIKRCFAQKGFIGIKLHPGLHGVNVAHEGYAPAMEYADKNCLPVLIHTWSRADLADTEKLARRYPCARFIAAHSGGDPGLLDEALAIIGRNENVFGDTALSYAPHRGIEYMVRKAGADKIIFGSDMPFYDPVFTLARIVCADIGETEIERIVGGNFRKICPGVGE